jgi:Mycothiol maleylpyruvate isomerase N-terminal domain
VTARNAEVRDVASVFLEAGSAFVAVAAAVDPARLAEPANDAWSLRELLAHAARGLLTVESTVAAALDPTSRVLTGAVDYFAAAMAAPSVHAGIVQRARDASAAVGDDPGGYARAALERVAPLVIATPPHREVQHAAGRLRFEDYLTTRIVELTLHTADVQLAIGEPVAFPDAPSVLTRDVLVGLVGRAGALAVACALTGRAGPRCNVLG